MPLRLPSGLLLRNRLAKAALTEGLADRRGRPGAALERLYRRWGASGAGLSITGNAMVDGRYLERTGNVVLDDPAVVPALRAWAGAAREGGTPLLLQLNHAGRQTNRYSSGRPLAPSEVAGVHVLGLFARPRALTEEGIADVVARFAAGATRAREAGFDGVQVHAAHGYLLAQFLSPLTNLRTDRWGGGLPGRARLLLEVVAAVRAATDRSFTLAVKLNSADFQRGGFAEDEALEVVRRLEVAGVDLLEISGGTYESPVFLLADLPASTRAREAYFLDFARRVRAISRIPLMVTGGFRSAAAMEAALAEGALDLVGLGRPLIVDPEAPARLLGGRAARIEVRSPALRGGQLAALAEAAWFYRQLERLGAGRDPDPGISPTWTALRYAVRETTRSLGWRLRRAGRSA
jgi:2,4-dienoyl-CoA reductase-like NADH-dependent reductase (Old Yellow Enzyme family)